MDGDGNLDILSGSWPGELYIFRGEGKGKFAAGETLKDKDGKPIKPGNASTVFAFDWTGDGKLDLLVGNIEGQVAVMPNEGNSKAYAFGKALKLTADGKEITVGHGDSHPIVADWNGDGAPDLIVGSGDGSVVWFRNAGRKTEPKLEASRTILSAAPRGNDHAKPGQCGTRTKVCVTDWNGDGRADLLVGDFNLTQGERPKLTEADEKEQKGAQERLQQLSKELQPFFDEAAKLGRPGTDPKDQAEWEKKYEALRAKHQKVLDEQQKAFQVIRKFQAPYTYDGFVWVLVAQK